MRLSFSDLDRIKERAEHDLESGLVQVQRWWSRKYDRPANDPLFLDRSLAEHQREMFADLMFRERELQRDLEDETTTEGKDRLLEELQSIQKALGKDVQVQDDLFDEWEAAVARGEIPDLDKMPGD